MLQVTVAVVRYEALARQRVGVTSTLLAERLQVHLQLPVSFQFFSLTFGGVWTLIREAGTLPEAGAPGLHRA